MLAWLWPVLAPAQEQTEYLLGERQGLEMIVHIIGEVQKPGEYRVRDRTDVLELLSKAGGPTEFSRLSSVTVRRVLAPQHSTAVISDKSPPRIDILDVDLEKSWHQLGASPPPLLKPGDVVWVPTNSWYVYKRVSRIVLDAAIVASSYFLYLRVTQ